MSRTFCTVISDPQAESLLAPYGELMARVRHWSFKQVHVLGRSVSEVKKEAQLRFGVTARQFNGVRFDLDQAVNGWKGTLAFRIQTLKDSIEATVERIAALERRKEKARTEKTRKSLHFKQVGKKQRLDVLRGELSVAERELAAGKPLVCFGGRSALREAVTTGEMWKWHDRRNGRIFLVGSKDEGINGNQSVHWDGESLRIRMPDSLGGQHVALGGVKFRYGQKELEAVLERNKDKRTRVSLTWLIFRDDEGRWHAHVTVEEPAAPLVTSLRNGVVAVDLNADHLAVVLVDRCGNPVSRLRLDFPPSGTDEGRASVILGDAVRALCLIARSRGLGIACEDLDFSRKKAGLREYGARHARMLSGWAYARFFQLLQARCKRDGVEMKKVNPAFTSVIGRWKYAKGRAMSVHHGAALAIGRLAMGFGERLVDSCGSALDAPARMRPRTERKRWRGVHRDVQASSVRRLSREGARAPACTARSGTGAARKGGPRCGPAPATAGGATCPDGTGRRRTRSVPVQVGDAVAPAKETVSLRG
jgi:IS605 OrfB family transposase